MESTNVARREFAYTATNTVSQTRGSHAERKHRLTFANHEMERHENKIVRHGKPLSERFVRSRVNAKLKAYTDHGDNSGNTDENE